MKAFTYIARPLLEQVRANLRGNGLLGQVRDALLPKLLSGQISLPTAPESAVEVRE